MTMRSGQLQRAPRGVGARLTVWRRILRLSIDEVAARSGVSTEAVERIERGEDASAEA